MGDARYATRTGRKAARAGMPDEDWKDRAACKGMDTNLWFAGRGRWREWGVAKGVCARCPVSKECLSYALKHNEKLGIWGGMSLAERRSYLRQQQIQSERSQWSTRSSDENGVQQ